jgi:hypothetical protein
MEFLDDVIILIFFYALINIGSWIRLHLFGGFTEEVVKKLLVYANIILTIVIIIGYLIGGIDI